MQIGNNGKFFKSSDILNLFLTDVRRYDVPAPQEQEELYKKYKAGDENAGDMLILGNLRFIYSLAKVYARDESEVMDYVDEGVEGVKIAIRKFDPSKGVRFLTYAVWYARRQMNYYLLTKRDMIRRTSQVGNIIKKAETIRQREYALTGEIPTDDVVKKIMLETYSINVTKMEDLSECGLKSIDEDVCDDYTVEEASEFNERTASYNDYEDTIENDYRTKFVSDLLSRVDSRAAKVIAMKFGVGYERAYTDEEIAEKCCINLDKIGDICDCVLAQLRQIAVKRVV